MSETGKMIYRFGGGVKEGDRTMKGILGGKGANLAEMSAIGLPVPPGFTISAEMCSSDWGGESGWPDGLEKEVKEGIRHIESLSGCRFGEGPEPLLLSVRSGAAVSMPGMMDTILNLGLNDETARLLAVTTGNRRFALDCYRRFITMYADVVMQVDPGHFEGILQELKRRKGIEADNQLDADDLEELLRRYKRVWEEQTGSEFLQDPMLQLKHAIQAVFRSWNNPRAITYRQANGITGVMGTAVTLQAMVFGNMGEDSATGVCFTRNPSTGRRELYGEYLPNAQGEDVVAGIRTPLDIEEMQQRMPGSYTELLAISRKLEFHFRDMQDLEFTIQKDRLYLLQTRSGKRTGPAALRIAVDMVGEGVISEREAVLERVEPMHLEKLLHTRLATEEIGDHEVLGRGLAASPGAAVGRVVFTSQEALLSEDPVILVRVETSPDEITGMLAAEGILTSHGGKTSHAAVVARGWGKPCVTGCSELMIDYNKRTLSNGSVVLREGEWISIDGGNGMVLRGRRPILRPEFDDYFYRFMEWVDRFSTMQVRANADSPEDALRAVKFGATGIGLCRTEHMFFGKERILAVRRVILSENPRVREEALARIQEWQKEDFTGIFQVMGGRPVTIRLLDPPLHEFLPSDRSGVEQLAADLGLEPGEVENRIRSLHEFNPMLGHRGCRLGITRPEITQMQTRAILEAALQARKQGIDARPEIMIPLAGSLGELEHQRAVVEEVCREMFRDLPPLDVPIGTMIEVPRAALVAGKMAERADFFSFGTNDLTQMTFGFSRDDTGSFLKYYLQEGVLKSDPFQSLDTEGVGRLIGMAVREARERKPELKIGICGEHGGDPASIRFFQRQGFDYISCSPFRIPVARLAAAQASLQGKGADPGGPDPLVMNPAIPPLPAGALQTGGVHHSAE